MLPKEQLVCNPDCGLKTRTWPQVGLLRDRRLEAAPLFWLNLLDYCGCPLVWVISSERQLGGHCIPPGNCCRSENTHTPVPNAPVCGTRSRTALEIKHAVLRRSRRCIQPTPFASLLRRRDEASAVSRDAPGPPRPPTSHLAQDTNCCSS